MRLGNKSSIRLVSMLPALALPLLVLILLLFVQHIHVHIANSKLMDCWDAALAGCHHCH